MSVISYKTNLKIPYKEVNFHPKELIVLIFRVSEQILHYLYFLKKLLKSQFICSGGLSKHCVIYLLRIMLFKMISIILIEKKLEEFFFVCEMIVLMFMLPDYMRFHLLVLNKTFLKDFNNIKLK